MDSGSIGGLRASQIKWGTYALLLVGLAVLYWIVTKVRAGLSMLYSVGLPTQFRIAGTQLQFVLPMTLTSRTNTALVINGLDMDILTAGNTYLGRALITTPITIPGSGSATLPVLVGCYITDLLLAIPDLKGAVTSKQLAVKYSGTVTVQGFALSVAGDFTMTIPVLSNLF